MASVTIRLALPTKAGMITRQRRAMFAEIRQLPPERLDAMDAAFAPWIEARPARGEYLGWFAVNESGEVVGGAGVS